MPAGYVIAQLKVTNPENYKEYVAKVSEVVKKYDGEYLVRNGEYQVVEGEDNFPRLVIIRFPSYERALEWYHSDCLLYTSPSPRDGLLSRMPSSA